MIRLALICFLGLLLKINCFAQDKMSLILIGMPNRSYLLNKYDKDFESKYIKMPSYNFVPGVLLRKQLKGRFHINFGLYYSFQPQKFIFNFNGIKQDDFDKGKTILSYIKFPILIQYNFIDKENFKFFINTGPQASFLIVEEGAIVIKNDVIEVGGAYKPLVIDGAVALGVEFKVFRKIYYTIQLNVDHSLHNVTNRSYRDVYKSSVRELIDLSGNKRSEEYNMTLGLLNGISIKIK